MHFFSVLNSTFLSPSSTWAILKNKNFHLKLHDLPTKILPKIHSRDSLPDEFHGANHSRKFPTSSNFWRKHDLATVRATSKQNVAKKVISWQTTTNHEFGQKQQLTTLQSFELKIAKSASFWLYMWHINLSKIVMDANIWKLSGMISSHGLKMK